MDQHIYQFKLAMLQNNVKDFKHLASLAGIKYQTLLDHLEKPELFRLYELKAVDDILHFPDEVLISFIRNLKD